MARDAAAVTCGKTVLCADVSVKPPAESILASVVWSIRSATDAVLCMGVALDSGETDQGERDQTTVVDATAAMLLTLFG